MYDTYYFFIYYTWTLSPILWISLHIPAPLWEQNLIISKLFSDTKGLIKTSPVLLPDLLP